MHNLNLYHSSSIRFCVNDCIPGIGTNEELCLTYSSMWGTNDYEIIGTVDKLDRASNYECEFYYGQPKDRYS